MKEIDLSHIKVTEFKVQPCERSEIRDFIEKWHYSGSINGVRSSYCFKLTYGDILVGAMMFGGMGMANTWKRYVEREEDLIELRRLCCIDKTKRNTESYFIGWCLRWLKQNTEIKKVVSYADSFYNHEGIIYKATNFKLVGKTPKGKLIKYNNKLYHDKCIRTKYKGKLKPFAAKIKEALENNEAEYVTTTGKNIYLYVLKE